MAFKNSQMTKKHIIYASSNIFSEHTLLTSDLHSHSFELFERLRKTNLDLTKYNVIVVGDMAGNYIRGADGNPSEFYNYLLQIIGVKNLFIIQGNHDLPPRESKLNPTDRMSVTKCILRNGEIMKTCLGKIGGVNGIISNKPHPYKMPQKQYLGFMKKLIGHQVDILLTHDTPRFFHNNREFIGKDEIYEMARLIKPKVYIYGHCHHPQLHTVHEKIHFLNVDGRVVLIKPIQKKNPLNIHIHYH